MATTIKLKNGSGAPLAGDLVQGEPALDLTNKRLYTEDSGGTVIEVGTNPSTLTVDTTTLVVDAGNNRVGVGTASPDGKLNVFSASAGSVSADADADELVLENSGNVGLSLLTASTGESGIYFGNPGTNGQKDFYLKYYHESHATTANRRAFTFNTASTERMRIDSSGNVGIGTASPVESSGYNSLTINDTTSGYLALQSAGSTKMEAYVSGGTEATLRGTGVPLALTTTAAHDITFDTNAAERMRIDSSGNVGINTSSPLVPLHAETSGTSTTMGDNPVATFRSKAAGRTATLQFSDGAITTAISSLSGALGFLTNNTERMRIDSSGNVGINNTSPSSYYATDLVVGAAGEGGITIASTAATVTGYLMFADGTTGDARYRGYIAYGHNTDLLGLRSASDIQFLTGGSTERMRIDSSGNVGIGTSSPAVELQVVGGIRFSSSGTDANRWNVYWNGTTGDLIVVSSDARLKEDFDYDIEGIETVKKLKPVRFTWKENNKRQLGFTAQESLAADQHLAWHDAENDQWGLDGWEGYAAVLSKAIQEQQVMIEELKAEVAALKGA